MEKDIRSIQMKYSYTLPQYCSISASLANYSSQETKNLGGVFSKKHHKTNNHWIYCFSRKHKLIQQRSKIYIFCKNKRLRSISHLDWKAAFYEIWFFLRRNLDLCRWFFADANRDRLSIGNLASCCRVKSRQTD